MRKIIRGVISLLVSGIFGVIQGQQMSVGSGGSVTVSAGNYVHVGGNLTVNASCSLTIQSNATASGSLIVTGTATGDITYERNIPTGGAVANDWYLVSPPVQSQSINSFVTNASNSVRTNGANYAVAIYNNANPVTRWEYYTTTNAPGAGNFTNGVGYSTSRGSAGNFTFTGTMAVTDVSATLMSTTTGIDYWFCIGNPYPSFLPGNNSAVLTNNVLQQNIGRLDTNRAALYVWDSSLSTPAYVAYNHASGSAFYLAPGQAFMVKTIDDSEMFTFTESFQSHQSGTDNFSRSVDTMPVIELELSNGSATKMTTIKYFSHTTTGLDIGYDAGTFDGGPGDSFSISTHLVSDSTGTDFMLQCLPDSNYETMVVPLSVNAGTGETLTFSAVSSNLPVGIYVYIEDSLTNEVTRIDDGSSYEVTLTETENGIGRFYLHTTQSVLDVEDLSLSNSISMYKTDATNLRITGLDAVGEASLRMYTITGREVFNHRFTALRINDIALPDSLGTGIYITEVESEQGRFTKKIIIE
ncbi:MAG: T9SS type A sorting domain-containing protein [Flavobacteriaceae bacterium]|nr:MAG: T9SS type A sorting domain-containing protein [Flavobacteriaceae bacterium]